MQTSYNSTILINLYNHSSFEFSIYSEITTPSTGGCCQTVYLFNAGHKARLGFIKASFIITLIKNTYLVEIFKYNAWSEFKYP